MANENDIPLVISAETADALKSIGAFGDRLTKEFGAIEKAIDKGFAKPIKQIESQTKISSQAIAAFLGNIASSAASAALSFAKLSTIDFLGDAISSAVEAEDQLTELNLAMASVGDFTSEASAELKKFANELQQNSIYTDDAAVKALTYAKNTGLSNEAAKDLVQTAANAARVLKTDLVGATEALIQANNGNTRALKVMGPEFANISKEAGLSGEAYAKVKARTEGLAEAMTHTLAGALAQARNSFDDFKKSVGDIIIGDPKILDGIKAFTNGMQLLKNSLEQNPDAIRGLANAFIDLVGVVGPVLIKFAGATISVLANIAGKFDDVTTTIAGGADKIAAGATRALGDVQSLIPGLGDASKANYKLADSLSTAGNRLIEEGKKGTAFSKATKDASDQVDRLTFQILKVVESSRKGAIGTETLAEKLEKMNKKAKDSAGAFQKLSEEGQKFLDDLVKSTEGEFEKIYRVYNEDIQNVEKYFKGKNGLTKQGLEAKQLIEEKYQKDFSNALKKAGDEERAITQKKLDDQKKQLGDARKQFADIFKDPVSIFNLDSASLQNGVAAALGGVSQILKGKDGATELVASLGSAFAEATLGTLIPGIGGAVGPLLEQFAKGPEATKEAVREFVDAIPQIVIAIAEAAPAFVEALVDSLVNKGGAGRIGVAIAKAFYLAPYQSLGKNLGLAIAQTLSGEMTQIISRAGREFGIHFTTAAKEAAFRITESIIQGAEYIFKRLSDAFNIFDGKLLAFTTNFIASIDAAFATAGQSIVDAISDSFSSIELPTFETPSWLEDLTSAFDLPSWVEDLIDALKNPGNIGGGGGGKGIIAETGEKVGKALGFASGGVVPRGYPNDSFPASLTSGELIVPTDLVGQLSSFLSSQVVGGGSDVNTALLGQIAAAIKQPIVVETTAEVNGDALANILLRLSRRNARLTA